MLQLLGICRLCNDMFIYAECIFYFCLMKMKMKKKTVKEFARNNFRKVDGKKTKLNAMIHSKKKADFQKIQSRRSLNPSPF